MKKPDLKPDLLASYRPIANIPFLSKVLEKSAAIQVHNYLNDNDLFSALQFAYRKYHSTETALLRVTDDTLKTLDSSGEVLLVLLDLSTAFDTLGHQILLERLRIYFNLTETALKWFSSYLLGRSQLVSIADATSPPRCLEYGDYCNSLLYDVPKYQRDKLQRIQNTATRMITGAHSSDPITPLLKSLHWLPAEARIHFKILLITYKI